MALVCEMFSNVESVRVLPHEERIPVSDDDIAAIEEWLTDEPTKVDRISMAELRSQIATELRGKENGAK